MMVRPRKTKFDCGHKGLGGYCHLCKQLESGELIPVSSSEDDKKTGPFLPNPDYISQKSKRKVKEKK